MKKYITIVLASLLCLQSCAQNDKMMNEKVVQLLDGLYKEVQHYDERISYHATLLVGGCNYEMLINDFPVDRYFGSEHGSSSGSMPINRAILKPGLQAWKIRIYPIHDQKETNNRIQMVPRPAVESGARIELSIEGIRFKKNGDVEKRFGKVLDFKAPLIKDGTTGESKLADAGKPYIQYSGTFRADVPYRLSGWESSDDLSKDDKKDLELALLKEYEKYHNWIQNRALDKIAESNFRSEQEEAQALFYDSATNNTVVEENYIKGWGQKGLKAYPLENYTIKYYGNGKLVTLQRKDFVGDPVLAGEFENGKTKTKQMKIFYLYFHRPKGKTTLEVIR